MNNVLCNAYSVLQCRRFPELVYSSGSISRRASSCLLEFQSCNQCASLRIHDNSEQKNCPISESLKKLINKPLIRTATLQTYYQDYISTNIAISNEKIALVTSPEKLKRKWLNRIVNVITKKLNVHTTELKDWKRRHKRHSFSKLSYILRN